MKVLIVDEEPDVRKLVAMSFRMQQPTWEILGAEDGPEALELIGRQRPDVVLLDVGLPEMSGFEVLKAIRLFSDVPVIMLTVRDDELSKVQGLELGADDYVTKRATPGAKPAPGPRTPLCQRRHPGGLWPA
jgi:two-component system response regulator VicR